MRNHFEDKQWSAFMEWLEENNLTQLHELDHYGTFLRERYTVKVRGRKTK